MSEQLSAFDTAVVAFEIRFEMQLVSRWESLESQAAAASSLHNPPEKNRSVLTDFFEAAESEISSTVHEYFPKLLQVAIAQRHHLGNQSPLNWTESEIRRQVCAFLDVDQKFGHASLPRDDSRIARAAVRIALNIDWQDEVTPSDFVLPGWLDSRWAMKQALLHANLWTQDAVESLPPLSRADTLGWLKQREFWISKRLERQIENDSWDGIIEAGKSNVSILDAFSTAELGPGSEQSTHGATDPNVNSFIREATTWIISFGGESCRLKTMIGLDYISILLQYPGKAMNGLELQRVAGGMVASPGVAKLSEEDVYMEKIDAEDYRSTDQSDYARHVVLDDRAIREYEAKLLDLETRITCRSEIGDIREVERLQKDYQTIEFHLARSRSLHHRSREFSGEQERARTSITNALKRAYKGIQAQAPKAAAHLRLNISTGSQFVYGGDASKSWNVRRISPNLIVPSGG